MKTLNHDNIPVIIEVGGYDVIMKSVSLKASRCLQISTLLVKGSPSNHSVLTNSCPYDWTVHGVLCEDEYVYMEINALLIRDKIVSPRKRLQRKWMHGHALIKSRSTAHQLMQK